MKLFLAFSDANDIRTDGASPLHICLVINPENAWFLAQPLVAAGADMNCQWFILFIDLFFIYLLL